MTAEEHKAVKDYMKDVHRRINEAKDAINHWNFGEALAILSEPFPILKLTIDDDEG